MRNECTDHRRDLEGCRTSRVLPCCYIVQPLVDRSASAGFLFFLHAEDSFALAFHISVIKYQPSSYMVVRTRLQQEGAWQWGRRHSTAGTARAARQAVPPSACWPPARPPLCCAGPGYPSAPPPTQDRHVHRAPLPDCQCQCRSKMGIRLAKRKGETILRGQQR